MRRVFPSLILALSVFALSACGGAGSASSPAAATSKPVDSTIKPAENASYSAWKITVAGLGQEAALTATDLQKIGTVKIKASMKEKETKGPEEDWAGAPLAKVLKYLGVTQYTTVKVESRDGAASKEYTPDLVDSEGTILGTELNGKPLDGERGPVQLVVNGKGSNWWIKQVAKITVIK